MSKLIPSISGVACFLWVAIWSWWIPNENASLIEAANSSSKTAISIVTPDSVLTAFEIFSFHKSDDKPVLPESNIEMLRSLAGYLRANPEQSLTLVGEYLPMPFERNQSPYPNLGLARAHSIKNILVAEGANPDQIQTAGEEVDTHTKIEDRMLGGVEFIFGKSDEADSVEGDENESVASGDLKTEENNDPEEEDSELSVTFRYDENDFALARENRQALDNLRSLVRKNPSYTLIITGFSEKGEEKNVDNLAERRSLAVRRYLVDTGVRRRNIIVESHPGAAKDDAQRRVEITVVK
jgi:outer membrane protein OmpA-like peptidoglycan-associated protein